MAAFSSLGLPPVFAPCSLPLPSSAHIHTRVRAHTQLPSSSRPAAPLHPSAPSPACGCDRASSFTPGRGPTSSPQGPSPSLLQHPGTHLPHHESRQQRVSSGPSQGPGWPRVSSRGMCLSLPYTSSSRTSLNSHLIASPFLQDLQIPKQVELVQESREPGSVSDSCVTLAEIWPPLGLSFPVHAAELQCVYINYPLPLR